MNTMYLLAWTNDNFPNKVISVSTRYSKSVNAECHIRPAPCYYSVSQLADDLIIQFQRHLHGFITGYLVL